VLAPGGRVALNVWGALERQPFYVALVGGIVRFLGEDARAGFDLAFRSTPLRNSERLRRTRVSKMFASGLSAERRAILHLRRSLLA
jgi:hypothetical protein